MEEFASSSVHHYQITFFSNNENYKHIPDCSMSVPTTTDVDNLNTLVNQLLSDASQGKETVIFDFIIGSTILRTSLKEFVEANNLAVESTIKIECIVQEPAPKPANDLSLPDWVGAVRGTEKFIVSATYEGEVVIFSHLGKEIASWDLHDGAIKCLGILSDNSANRLVTGGHDQVLKISYVDKAAIRPTHVLRGHERSVECLAVNSDGSRLISGGFDKVLKVWNVEEDDTSTIFEKEGGQVNKKKRMDVITKTPMVTLAGHKDAIVGAAWSPISAKEVVTVSWDHVISIWDLELAGQTNTLSSTKAFTGISICPSSSLLITSSADSVLRLWDTRSYEGSLVKQTYIGHKGWVSSVFWNQKKENLFISSSFDKTVKMWDMRSNKTPLYDMCGHNDRVLCCDWSVDSLILSGGVDCTLKIYRK